MLIYFDNDIIKKFKNGNYTELELESLERIVASHINSQHYIFADRMSLYFLSKFQELSSTARNYLRKLEYQYTTIGAYIKQIKTRIRIVDRERYFNKNKNDSFTEFEVSIDYFDNPRTLDCTKLITENMDDCDFYKDIARHYPTKLPSMLFNFTVDSHDGNGHGITKSYKDKVNQQNSILTIVDSDKKHPEAEYGTTAKGLYTIYKENKDEFITNFIALTVHEKENLVPYQFYKVLNIGNDTMNKLDIISRNKELEDFFYYFDYKEGINTDNYIDYFDSILSTEGIIEQAQGNDRDIFYGTKEEFLEYIALRRNDKDNYQKKYILKPLGDNLLKDFSIENMKAKVDKKLLEIEKIKSIPTYVKDNLIKIRDILHNPFDHLLTNQKGCLEKISEEIIYWGLCKPRNATG